MSDQIRRRKVILEAVRTRLQEISVADGYLTDAGRQVSLGLQPAFSDQDPDVGIAIVVGPDRIEAQHTKLAITLPVEVQAVAKADLDDPFLTIEDVISDIKQALERADDRLLDGLLAYECQRGSTRQTDREPGSTTVGIGITYEFFYEEGWGDT